MNIVKDAVFTQRFNQLKHEFEIYLDNGSGTPYPINPNAIINLSIQETLVEWSTRGVLTFSYNPESGSEKYDNATGQYESATTGISLPNGPQAYVFRNDGNDLLRIRIKPILNDNKSPSNINSILKDIDPVMWSLSYLFSIYDVEDVESPPGATNAASSMIKCLKVYFNDFWYQKMSTYNLEYSTGFSDKATSTQSTPGSIYSNPASILTGDAMQEIIEQSLEGVPHAENPIDKNNWDKGATNIFYTAPTETTAYDSLMYIYNYHSSTVKNTGQPQSTDDSTPDIPHDFCILTKERGPTQYDVGQFSLKSMASYYEKAGKNEPGEYQYEHFYLQSYGDTKSRSSKTMRSPTSNKNSSSVDMKLSKYNIIKSYQFVDIAAITNSNSFCTTPVHSFDFNQRIFNVDFENNSVQSARTFMVNNYINNLYTQGGQGLGANDLFLITLDKDKQSKNVKPVFTPYGDDIILRQTPGLQTLLKIGVYHNACINFRALGLPFREPGTFIAIDKTEGVDPSAFADKFFGQWLIIDVKHVFETEMYYNDITAVKINRYAPLDPQFNDII